MLLRNHEEPADPTRAAAAARMLDLRPVTGGELAVTLQIIGALVDKTGEVRIVRVGTATVVVAGTELLDNEVGGDGPNVVEAVVAVACDFVRCRDARARLPVTDEPEDEDDAQGSFAW